MISILMSTYNGEKTLSRAINSILNQSYDDFEFIICDDSSNDNTLKILKNFSSLDKRIIIIHNDFNLGLQTSLNKCLKKSKGEFIARMDDDDFAYKDRLKIELNYLKKNNKLSFVGSNICFYSYDRGIYGEQKYPVSPNKYDLIKACPFSHPTILIKSNVIKSVGGYSEKNIFYRVEDYELWLRLYSKGYRGGNVQSNLLIYKKDRSSISNIKIIDRINLYKLLSYYYKILNINKKYYIFIVFPLIKILFPSKLRTFINYIKYSSK